MVLALVVVTAFLAPPAQPAFAATASAISTGGRHTCAVTTAGGLECWGLNEQGQLGDGTTTQRATRAGVTGLTTGVAAVSAGASHTCILTTSGGLECWGNNISWQLGSRDSRPIRTTPLDVTGLTSGVTAVSAGLFHTCALTTAGGLKCWGFNFDGQVGDGIAFGFLSPTPVDVIGLTSGVTAVSAGSSHNCAVTTAGGIKCWGWNDFGQLGDGTSTARDSPVDVVGLTQGVSAVSAGLRHTCAVTTSGRLKCWGWNDSGQLGDGTTIGSAAPVGVSGFFGPVAPIPSLSRWGLIAIVGLTASFLLWRLRRSGLTGRLG